MLIFQVPEKKWSNIKYVHLHIAFETPEVYWKKKKKYLLCSYLKSPEPESSGS